MRLTLRHCWPDKRDGRDFQIFLEGFPIGRMYEYRHGPQHGRWFWTVGTRVSHPWMRGVAENLEAAKANARQTTEKLVSVYGLPSTSQPAPF